MYDSSPRQKQSSEAYGYQDSYYTTAPRQPRTRSQTRLNSEFAPNANDYPVYSQSSKSLDKSQRARSLDAVRGAASQEDIGRQISGPRGNNGPQGGVTIPIRIERGPARTFDQDRERDHRRVENSQNYNAGYNIGSRRPTAENNPYQRQGHRAYDDPSPRSYDDSMIMKSSRNYDSPSMPRIQRPHPDDTAILKPRGFEESAVQSHGRYYEDDVAMRAPRGYDDGYIPRSQRNYDDAPMMRREWSSSLDRLDRRMQDSSKRSPNMLNRSYGNARDFKLDTRPSFGPRYPAGYKESGGGGQGYRQHSSYHYESGGGPTSHGAMVSQPPSPHRRGIISQQPQAMNTMGRRTAGGHENMMITSSSGAHHHQQQQINQVMKLLILFTNLVCIYCYYGTMRNNPTIVVEEQQALDLPSNTKTDYVRACYFTNWSQYRQGRGKYVPEDYIPGLCTHILFAFGWMNEDFTVRAFDPADLPNDWAGEGLYRRLNNMKRVDTNLKTLLSIGGWSFGTRLFKDMAKSAASRKVFIDSSIQFVRKWNFDGIDIDWEYPAGPEDFKDFALLVKEIKEAAVAEAKTSGKNVLLITAAVSASKVTIDNGYDVPEISLYFDYIFLMNYDFHGAWSTDIGFNSPLYSRQGMKPGEEVWNIDFAAKYWNQKGMPKEKIIVGVATYGRGWTMKDPNNANPGAQGSPARVTPYTQEAGVASYYELCDMLSKGAKRYWHDEQKVPYLIDGDQFWGYDDKESVQIKMDYIKDQQFGGAFVWTLDFDDFNGQCPLSDGEQYPLIGVIAKELAGITIPRKTVPTIAPTAVPTIPTVPVTTQRPSTPMPTVGPIITTTTAAEKNICKGRPEGFSGDLTDCQQFVLCLLDKSYKMRCPLGLHFSPSRKYCVLKSDSDCVDASPPSTKAPTPTTTTTQSTIITTQAGSTVSTGGFVCSGDGFYGDPSNCAKFFRCVNGLKYSFECASGLSFHNDSLMCDHPDPSKCAQPL